MQGPVPAHSPPCTHHWPRSPTPGTRSALPLFHPLVADNSGLLSAPSWTHRTRNQITRRPLRISRREIHPFWGYKNLAPMVPCLSNPNACRPYRRPISPQVGAGSLRPRHPDHEGFTAEGKPCLAVLRASIGDLNRIVGVLGWFSRVSSS
jgi:hypothetical protein